MSKKIIKTVISSFLVLLLLFSGCSSSCGNKEGDEGNKQMQINSTDYKIVENGKSNYRIVICDDAKTYEKNAASELVIWMYEVCGQKLPIVTESQVDYSPNAKLIILGNTKFTDKSGIDQSTIKAQNFRLKTVDENLFIVGGDELGTLYGMYEFLHQNFGYEAYAMDEFAIDRNVSEKLLLEFDMGDGPDIQWRQPNYGSLDSNLSAMRFRLTKDPWMRQNGNFVHNSLSEYLPYNVFGKEHGEWYDNYGNEQKQASPTQLCYSAHGDEEELAEMRTAVVERMKALINYFYESGEFKEMLSFTHEDNGNWCNCDKCRENLAKYGTESSSVILFLNPVAKEIKEWMKEAWPGREVTIAFFAYMKTLDAPVKLEGDKYVPMDDSLVLEDNVALFYAPYYAEFSYDFNHQKNATYNTQIKKWEALTSKMAFWLYSTNFVDYLAWYDSFNSMIGNYKYVKDHGGYFLFDQARYDVSALTGFDYLKAYLNSKLAWNVDDDFNALVDNFFENYFKQASVPMRKYYDSYRSWSLIAREELGMGSSVRLNIYDKKFFPKQVLCEWAGYIEEAYKAIEDVRKTDEKLYNKLYDRINKESIAIRYHLIQYYGTTYDKAVDAQMKIDFKKDADNLGFAYLGEAATGMTLSKLVYEKWGLI